MSRRPLALGVSLIAHVGLVAIVVVSAAHRRAGPHTIQLNGEPQERQAGRDMLFEVLRGDGIPIRLTSATGDSAVGLAWWSPSVGLWLATDRVSATPSGGSLRVSMQIGSGTPKRIGVMDINDDGAGRIVAVWADARPPAGTPVTLTVSERGSLWRWREPPTALAGTTPMR
jgi:hypothetical protein